MSKQSNFPRRTLSAFILCASVFGASAAQASYYFNFDGVTAGTTANAAIGTAFPNVSFANAVFAPNLDIYGSDIPGTEHWQVDADPTTPAVIVENPLSYSRGAAPSGTNALNALWQPVLMQFSTPINLSSFAATQENSSFGLLAPAHLLFLDSAGAVLKDVAFDQTIPGFTITTGAFSGNVSSIVLPSGKFYDNMNVNVSAVPIPAAWVLLSSGLMFLGYKRKRTT